MCLVIAGNYKQFADSEFYHYRYINDITKLYGHCDTKIYLIREYWLNEAYNHPDFNGYCYSHNIKIMK